MHFTAGDITGRRLKRRTLPTNSTNEIKLPWKMLYVEAFTRTIRTLTRYAAIVVDILVMDFL